MNNKNIFDTNLFFAFLLLIFVQMHYINGSLHFEKTKFKSNANVLGYPLDHFVTNYVQIKHLPTSFTYRNDVIKQPNHPSDHIIYNYSKTLKFLNNDPENLFENFCGEISALDLVNFSCRANSKTVDLLAQICHLYENRSTFKTKASNLLSKKSEDELTQLFLLADDLSIKRSLFHKILKLECVQNKIAQSDVMSALSPSYFQNSFDRKIAIRDLEPRFFFENTFFIHHTMKSVIPDVSKLKKSQKLGQIFTPKMCDCIEKIWLPKRNIKSFAEIIWIVKKFHNLKKINLSNNELQTISTSDILKMPANTTLTLSNNPIKKLEVSSQISIKDRLLPSRGLTIKLGDLNVPQSEIDQFSAALEPSVLQMGYNYFVSQSTDFVVLSSLLFWEILLDSCVIVSDDIPSWGDKIWSITVGQYAIVSLASLTGLIWDSTGNVFIKKYFKPLPKNEIFVSKVDEKAPLPHTAKKRYVAETGNIDIVGEPWRAITVDNKKEMRQQVIVWPTVPQSSRENVFIKRLILAYKR